MPNNRKRLHVGDQAPDFEVTDFLGNQVKLRNYMGSKIFISFFRGASCPFCNLRVRELVKNYSDFKKRDIQILTFFAATQEEILKYSEQQIAPFPIIPDPGFEVYSKYGVEQSLTGMFRTMIKPVKMLEVLTSGLFNIRAVKEKPIIPADFLISEDLRIMKVHYGKDFGDHMDLAGIWEDSSKWPSALKNDVPRGRSGETTSGA